MRAGKKYAVMNNMWLSYGAIELIPSIAAGSVAEPAAEGDEDYKKLLDEATQVYDLLPQHLKCHATSINLLKEVSLMSSLYAITLADIDSYR